MIFLLFSTMCKLIVAEIKKKSYMYFDPNKFIAILLLTTVVSYAFCLILALFFKNFGWSDQSVNQTQSAHNGSTSRLGGVGVWSTIIVVELLFGGIFRTWFFVAMLPIFLIGLLEDFHFETKPKLRLAIGIISSFLAIYLSKCWLTNIDFALVDRLLIISPFGIVFTVFASVGMINAINLIDGINGLASGKIVITSTAIFLIASQVGEEGIAAMAALIAAASLGLFFVSFPYGKIFMGDAGAYTLGFIVAWQIILLLVRNPQISAWSLLAIVFWPVMDTLFAIYRRISSGKKAGRPDLLHFHQLVMRSWEILSRQKLTRNISNPLATATIIPLTIPPVLLGIKFSHDVVAGQIIILVSALFYIGSYNVIFLVVRNSKMRNQVADFTKPFWLRIVNFYNALD